MPRWEGALVARWVMKEEALPSLGTKRASLGRCPSFMISLPPQDDL